jgi:hypothetical protein
MELVSRTKGKLCDAVKADFGDSLEENYHQLKKTFRGYCGLSQCISGYRLQDLGLSVKPLATQSLPNYYFGHAALTVLHKDNCQQRLYLIDPTFIQFRALEDCDRSPVHFLQCKSGMKLQDELLNKGYVQFSPYLSHLYLTAFCNGKRPFKSDQDAFDFCKKPPKHRYHFSHGSGSNQFDRSELAKLGLLIEP